MATEDAFGRINELVRRDMLVEALREIYDRQTGELKSPFLSDANHAWYVVGDIAFRLGDFESAIRAFTASVAAREDDIEALWALGNSYSEAGRADEAERILRRASTLDPQNEVLLYNLANALFDQEKYREAIDLYSSISQQNREVYEMAQKNLATSKTRLVRDDA